MHSKQTFVSITRDDGTIQVTEKAWHVAFELARMEYPLQMAIYDSPSYRGCSVEDPNMRHVPSMKITAIKALRLGFDLGLKEAKLLYEEAVDSQL